MFNKMSLTAKIIMQSVIVIVLFTAALVWTLSTFRTNMYKAKDENVKNVVDAAWTEVEYFVSQQKEGKLTLAEAQYQAKDVLKSMKYEGNNYFWINDMEPKMIMHPNYSEKDKPEWYAERGLTNYSDPNGVKLFVECVSVCRDKGAGYVHYSWTKVGKENERPAPKVSYVRLLPQWGWVIGSGVYVDDVEAEINKTLGIIIAVVVVLLVGVLCATIILARGITGEINKVIGLMAAGAEQVTSASSQIASSSQELAQGASEQASSLEETSSSLEEMTSMIQQNADNARQANVMAGDANRIATEGNASMKKMAESILQIQSSSNETAKIIKTIDEIAFQTNLLALNAAVEAARAGEAGKGFAVVAEEVRNLAKRSAEAAKTTSELIANSQKNVESGVTTSEEVKKILNDIGLNAVKVANLISEVSTASEEQARGIEQLNSAVNEMDKVTQRNSANAEESASAAEELSSQANELNDMIGMLINVVGQNSKTQEQAGHNEVQKIERSAYGNFRASNEKTDMKLHEILNKNRIAKEKSQVAVAGKVPGNGSTRQKRPAEIIPLNEDSDLKEF